MVRLKCALAFAALLLGGCETYSRLAMQHHLQLLEERDRLTAIKRALAASPDLKAGTIAEAFVSTSAINQVLAGADGRDFSLPRTPDTIIHLVSIRAAFGDGYPRLRIEATARRGSTQVRLSIEAYLQAVIDTADLDTAEMKVRLIDVVPDVKTGSFEFNLRGVARDVVKAKLYEYESRFPSFTIPLRREFRIDEAGGPQDAIVPIGGSKVPVRITRPAISDSPALRAKRIVFLSDGIHVLLAL
jgi:hypothetical protein